MKNLICLYFAFIPLISHSQVGAYIQGGFETFYTRNGFIAVGGQWKDHRVGYFYQEGKINGEGLYTRQGVWAEACLGNIDQIAFFHVGGRFFTSNDQFTGFVPNASVTFRIIKYVEIPITFSTFSSRLVNSIGLRIMFTGTGNRNKVHNSKRGSLQRTTRYPLAGSH